MFGSMYILVIFFGGIFNQAKKENPEAEFKEISNILGAKWKNVTAEEKKP